MTIVVGAVEFGVVGGVVVEMGVGVVVVIQFMRILFDLQGEFGSLIRAFVCALLSVGSRRFHFLLSFAMVLMVSKDK